MKQMEDWITVQEASVIANITEGYIRRMFIQDKFKDLKKGIDYTKFGKVWIIKKKAWEAHIKKINEAKNNK